MRLRVAVLGAGSWGSTVASLASHNAPVCVWARRPELAQEINEQRSNQRYLPGMTLPEGIAASSSIEETVRDADVVVMGVPSHGFRAVLQEVQKSIRAWVPIVSLAKGLEQESQLRMTQVIEEVLPGHKAAVLTGPNLAREIMGGYAAASVLAMEDEAMGRELQRIFRSGLFRVYTNRDVIGCELGGAFKNVIAIACGMGDAMGVGDNTRSAVITRGLAELTRLGVAMGGQASTFSGLAGLGDLLATCVSPQSRNRYVGEQIGKGRSIEEIIAEMTMVAEGVKTCRVVMSLAETHGVEMPIAREVYAAVHEGGTAGEAYRGLTRREPGAEHEPG
jgi:glycerol-3-phosphate dehydrogenase (NAD(P)+)